MHSHVRKFIVASALACAAMASPGCLQFFSPYPVRLHVTQRDSGEPASNATVRVSYDSYTINEPSHIISAGLDDNGSMQTELYDFTAGPIWLSVRSRVGETTRFRVPPEMVRRGGTLAAKQSDQWTIDDGQQLYNVRIHPLLE